MARQKPTLGADPAAGASRDRRPLSRIAPRAIYFAPSVIDAT
jgi:hypothetical protein